MDDMHLVHYGRFAMGGAGLIMIENTAVKRDGRITYGCPGLWDDKQIEPLRRIVNFAHACGVPVGVQLCHGGRKASSQRPWHGNAYLSERDASERGETPWEVHGPSSLPFDEGWPVPAAMTADDIHQMVQAYRQAAIRAREAGCDTIEIHCAHGYLLQNFLSPLANQRDDEYGGSLEGRMRVPSLVACAIRAEWPEDKPILARISSVDGVDIGWSIEDSVVFAAHLRDAGVDMIDCSSGGNKLPRGKSLVSRVPGFQVAFADRIKRELGMPTAAVGLIRDAAHAEKILRSGSADIIAVGREFLFNPNWALHAALELKGEDGWDDWDMRYAWWLRRRAHQQGDAYGKAAR